MKQTALKIRSLEASKEEITNFVETVKEKGGIEYATRMMYEFRDKALAGGFDKELEEVYLRSRISRLQALQTQVELRMMELFSSQRDVLRDHLQERYTDTYYRTVYAVSQQVDVASTFARIDPQTVEKILATPWAGSEFSSRIWADKDKLTRELMQTLSRGFVRGDSLGRMTKEFAQRMGVSESRAATLIHTESAHMRLKLPNRIPGNRCPVLSVRGGARPQDLLGVRCSGSARVSACGA